MGNHTGNKPISGIVGVRFQKDDGGSRPWKVVYKEQYYGGFPTVEEAAEFLGRVKDAVAKGEPTPQNPYIGQKRIRAGEAVKSTTGVSGIQRLTSGKRNVFKVVYRQKGYGQYKTFGEAKVRLEEVMYCIENGVEIPPSPSQKRHEESLKKAAQRKIEKEKAQKYREDQMKLRQQKREEEVREKARAKMEREANKSRPCKAAKYSTTAITAQAQIGQEEAQKNSGFHRPRNANHPQPVPIEERPKFKGKTQRERDKDACSKCYWNQTYMGGKYDSEKKIFCAYGLQDGNTPRIVLHYRRTGTQDPSTMTHGENCTEWTPKKGNKKQSTFTIKNDPF